eukprot:CAMPEP_0168539746 /NCGR_PEP_ID=MMETSP0405-20121227/22027_1 /TAXON_ID=498012 /ORGANISM="Trichosphaerium sp, Strain Am-I-7 wt" /LENGTH=262 /DNA_ID=CAMNT_0008569399 /DNA_START=165 /DNA_END=950 /DNA_ORIENTATION=-
MAMSKAVYPWDIVLVKKNGKMFFDKREKSAFDYFTVNENSHDPPFDDAVGVNGPKALRQEATFINQNFSQQVLAHQSKYKFKTRNPFQTGSERVASVGYKYQKWGVENYTVYCRSEIDSVARVKDSKKPAFVMIRALNEYDPKVTGDWRKQLENQRGSVLASETNNNNFKMTKWLASALIAGVDQICLGYVCRLTPKDNYNHQILQVNMMTPRDLVKTMKFRMDIMWGNAKQFFDKCMKLPDGKYVIMKETGLDNVQVFSVP